MWILLPKTHVRLIRTLKRMFALCCEKSFSETHKNNNAFLDKKINKSGKHLTPKTRSGYQFEI